MLLLPCPSLAVPNAFRGFSSVSAPTALASLAGFAQAASPASKPQGQRLISDRSEPLGPLSVLPFPPLGTSSQSCLYNGESQLRVSILSSFQPLPHTVRSLRLTGLATTTPAAMGKPSPAAAPPSSTPRLHSTRRELSSSVGTSW